MAAPGLTTVADTHGEKIPFPLETGPVETAKCRAQFGKSAETGEQIGSTAEDLFQILGGMRSHGGAEAAGGHVEEHPSIRQPQVHRAGFDFEQLQGFHRCQRYPGSTGEVVGRAQWQHGQAGLGAGLQHGLGDIAQGAVAAARDHGRVAAGQPLSHQALGVAGFPGQAYRQLPALLAQVVHCRPHLFVQCLLAMQDQPGLALAHCASSLKGQRKPSDWPSRKLIELIDINTAKIALLNRSIQMDHSPINAARD